MSKKSGLADSPFFPSLSEGIKANTTLEANTRTPEHANARTPELPKSVSGKRNIKRQSYNVYVDQHEKLLRLEATSALSGKKRAKSEMVREALDEYLKKHTG